MNDRTKAPDGVTYDDLQQLFDVLDAQLRKESCDHTRRMTERFLRERQLPVDSTSRWLRALGGCCDCEVVMNVEPQVAHRLERARAVADERVRTRVETVKRLCSDPDARRELLWIRAMSKGDLDDALWLAEADPQILARLARIHDMERVIDEAEREGTAVFDRVYDAHFALLEARYSV